MGRDCRICQLSSHPYKEMTQLTTEPASTSLKQHVLVGVLSVAHRRRNPALGLVGGNRQRCAHTSVVEQTHLRCMLCSSTCMALSFDQHSWSISPLLLFFFFLAFTEHQRLAEAISSSNQEPWRAETKQKFCETIELGHARRNRRESRALLGVAICGETCGAEVQYSTVQYSTRQSDGLSSGTPTIVNREFRIRWPDS